MANLSNVIRTLIKSPGFLSMRAAARFGIVRSAAVRVQRAWRGSLVDYLDVQSHRQSEFFQSLDSSALAARVDIDGIALGISLPPSVVSALMGYARTNPCWAERNPKFGFYLADVERARQNIGRRFLIAQYFNARRDCPLIARLVDDPLILGVAARYLGTTPTLVGVNLWWSFPEKGNSTARDYAAQVFHFDLDDFRFIKFFFYLTDVDESAGPHVAVRSTHRQKRHAKFSDRFKARRYSDQEIADVYGTDRLMVITGPAGTGFIEDTLCIHKGRSPMVRERLVLQLQYALNNFGNQHDDIDDSKLEMIA